jgi:hypothetical protein
VSGSDPTDLQIVAVVALADGSLPPERRVAAWAAVERSPLLRARLLEQRRVVACLRALDVRAPARLRARITGISLSGP